MWICHLWVTLGELTLSGTPCLSVCERVDHEGPSCRATSVSWSRVLGALNCRHFGKDRGRQREGPAAPEPQAPRSHPPASQLPGALPTCPGGLGNTGADPRNGFWEERSWGEEENPGGIQGRSGAAQPPAPAPAPRRGPRGERVGDSCRPGTPGRAGPPRPGAAELGGRVASAAGRGSRVRRGESLAKRAAGGELGVLGAPRAAGARAPGRGGDAASGGLGPRQRGPHREWEGERRRTEPRGTRLEAGRGATGQRQGETRRATGTLTDPAGRKRQRHREAGETGERRSREAETRGAGASHRERGREVAAEPARRERGGDLGPGGRGSRDR